MGETVEGGAAVVEYWYGGGVDEGMEFCLIST
jgi:hypothetical protein